MVTKVPKPHRCWVCDADLGHDFIHWADYGIYVHTGACDALVTRHDVPGARKTLRRLTRGALAESGR